MTDSFCSPAVHLGRRNTNPGGGVAADNANLSQSRFRSAGPASHAGQFTAALEPTDLFSPEHVAVMGESMGVRTTVTPGLTHSIALNRLGVTGKEPSSIPRTSGGGRAGRLLAKQFSAGGADAGGGVGVGELAQLLLDLRGLEVARPDHRIDEDALLLEIAEVAEAGILRVRLTVVVAQARQLLTADQLDDRGREFELS
jgi:hypothetical protein